MWCVFALITCSSLGSNNTRSASEPTAGIDQAHAVFDPRAAVGNLGEIVLAQLLLLLVTERAMIGGDHLQGILGQALPELFLVPFFAQRRREDILGALEAGYVEVFDGKKKVLRAGLSIGRQAAVARLADLLERFVA